MRQGTAVGDFPVAFRARPDARHGLHQRHRQVVVAGALGDGDADAAAGKPAGMPVTLLMTAVTLGGRDTAAQICPVFALRLRSSGGRQIADGLKDSMQKWDDQSWPGRA